MAIRLTEVWKTEDGEIFESKAKAEEHEDMMELDHAIRQAIKDSGYHAFGRHKDPTDPMYMAALCHELKTRGLRFVRRPVT